MASQTRPIGANFKYSDVPPDIEIRPHNFVSQDGAASKGMLYVKKGTKPRIGVHVMHPRTDQTQNYNLLSMAEAGFAALGRAGRWVNNDVGCIHEQILLDVAEGVRFLREEVGCESVILIGNSGGSSLGAFYQWQARQDPSARFTHTPAGDPFDLNGYSLPPADGVALIGGHVGEGELLMKWIDPSVADEGNPLSIDPELDMYDPDNGYRGAGRTTYDPDFLERYREGQRSRVRRIDAVAQQMVDSARQAKDLAAGLSEDTPQRRALLRQARAGWHLVIYRTCADPAMADLSIDPDDRYPGNYLEVDPQLENAGTKGFAHYLTPRAWLSTWSGLSSRVRTLDALSRIPDPVIVVHYAGDAGCRLSEAKAMVDSVKGDGTLHVVRNADHYGYQLLGDLTWGPRTHEGTDAIREWALERFSG